MNKKVNSKINKRKNKSGAGRPTKYDSCFCKMLIDHFNIPKNEKYIKNERITNKKNGVVEKYYEYGYRCSDLPTFDGFARKIEVNGDTIVEWATSRYSEDYFIKNKAGKLKHQEFSAAYNTAKELQKEFLIDNALKGFYPPASFIFIAKNITDMRDKQELDHTTKGKQIVGIDFIIPTMPQNDGKNTYKKSGSP